MKPENVVGLVIAVAAAAIMTERYYHHPTYGNGIKALLAALKAALAFE